MNVKLVGTTDDPIDSLEHHKAIAQDNTFDIEVVPSFRPDRAFKIELPLFNDYIEQLGKVADIDINTFDKLKQALLKRIEHFDQQGCKSADHGIEIVRFASIPDETKLTHILQKDCKINRL